MPIKPDKYVSPELAYFVNECEKLEPQQTGGLYPYANKSGYHNTANINLKQWPGEYSTQLPDDLRGDMETCRAFDWIFEDARLHGDRTTINKYGRRIRDAYYARDERFRGWREVLIQVDAGDPEGFNVGPGGWYTRIPDISHDMHGHFSVLTAYARILAVYQQMLSILAGEPLSTWRAGLSAYQEQKEDDDMKQRLVTVREKDGDLVYGGAVFVCRDDFTCTWVRDPDELNALVAIWDLDPTPLTVTDRRAIGELRGEQPPDWDGGTWAETEAVL